MPEMVPLTGQAATPAEPQPRRPALAILSYFGLAVVGIHLFWLQAVWTQQKTAARGVDHTIVVLSIVDNLERDLARFIREARGVVLLNRWDRMAEVDQVARLAPADIGLLRALTADNPAQQSTLARMEPLVTARIALMRDVIRRVHAGEMPGPWLDPVERQRSLALDTQIANTSELLKREERWLLTQRRAVARRAALLVWAGLLSFAVIGGASLAFALFLHATGRRERRSIAELSRLNAELERMTRHLVRARDAAERSNRAKTHFLAGMSHELRTPLNGILGYARLLRMEGGLSETQLARVDAMLNAGKHLLHMVARVLDLSEIEAERLVLQTELIDLPAAAAACIDLVRPVADQKGLSLTSSMAPGAPRCGFRRSRPGTPK